MLLKKRSIRLSCPDSPYWERKFQNAGHTVRIITAQFIKPYLKSNKNDFNDAEAASRATMRTVPLKTTDQLEMQAIHRVHQPLIVERTALVNQMRALRLEYGIVIPVGRSLFARALPRIFEAVDNTLSTRMRQLLPRSRQRWLALDDNIYFQ